MSSLNQALDGSSCITSTIIISEGWSMVGTCAAVPASYRLLDRDFLSLYFIIPRAVVEYHGIQIEA